MENSQAPEVLGFDKGRGDDQTAVVFGRIRDNAICVEEVLYGDDARKWLRDQEPLTYGPHKDMLRGKI